MKRKTALITGASRGIGKETAYKLADAGFNLYITCINSSDLLYKTANDINGKYHVMCTPFVGDMSDFETVSKLFEKIDDIDVLVNNAGISYFGLLSEMPVDAWNKVVATNLNAAFYCSKLAIPLMLKKKAGKIINISSVWGVCGASNEVAYSASKGGLNVFTKALAKELAPSNIQVNAIACGVIDTDMNSHFSDEEMSGIIDMIPSCRIGKASEAAHLVCQLADKNDYLTGQVICLDGGLI